MHLGSDSVGELSDESLYLDEEGRAEGWMHASLEHPRCRLSLIWLPEANIRRS